MNDPKQIYQKVDIRGVIGDRPIRYEIINKEWPANDLAYIRLYTADGRSGWTLVAPGSTVESVTVTNLTHTDIPAVTLNGMATLRLNNLDAAFETGDVNGDGSVDVADIATIISVMASGSAGDSPASADVNGDGTVDVADIATVIDIMAANARLAGDMED